MNASRKPVCLLAAMLVAVVSLADTPVPQDESADPAAQGRPAPVAQVISDRQRKIVDRSVDRALKWLASRQNRDGSFPTMNVGQPGITALCVQAFLTRGHLPGSGPYGDRLNSAVDFILSCQKTGGLIALVSPERVYSHGSAVQSGMYNHAIAGIVLCEVYGAVDLDRSAKIRSAIEKALVFTRERQSAAKRLPEDKGGWRYLRQAPDRYDSDLSITAWQLMFLRAARNAGFHVPSEQIDKAMAYVERQFDHRTGTFRYRGIRTICTRAMAGSGILSLAMGGMHDTPMARSAGDWILRHNFDNYNDPREARYERYHYGAYYCSQAMFQLGGEYWRQFYPRLARVLVANQNRDGSWQRERGYGSGWGNVYTTALTVQALTVPYQLLPIYQR